MIRFRCTNCGKELQTEDRFAGEHSRCPACQADVAVPGADPVVPSALPVEPPAPPALITDRAAVHPQTVGEAYRSVARRLDRALPLQPVKDRLQEEGLDEPTASAVVSDGVAAYRRSARWKVLLGLFLLVVGIGLTVLSFFLTDVGGRFLVFIGLIGAGGALFFRGLWQLHRAATAYTARRPRPRYL